MELRERRAALRISQSALAEAAGIAQATVSHTERGLHRPHPIVSRALDEALTRLENDNDPAGRGR
jgi:transcriptional regulator with XRE-family HTH domain